MRSTCYNNIAMLGKLVDSMLHERGKLWVRVLSEKYLDNDIILAGTCKSGDSYICKGIVQAKNSLAAGFGAQLGDGSFR